MLNLNEMRNGVNCYAIDFKKREKHFTALFESAEAAAEFYDALHDDHNAMVEPYKATATGTPITGISIFSGKPVEWWNEYYKAHNFEIEPTIDDYFRL